MKIYKILFSPTGGTKKAADALFSSLDTEKNYIDLTDKNTKLEEISIEPESLALIAVPSYSGRVPQTAIERLEKIAGNGAKCVLMTVYGNREYEDTLIELYDQARKCGFVPVAAVSAVAEHSIDREMAKGRPDSKDKEILKGYGEKIANEIENLTELSTIVGNRPYKEKSKGSNCPQVKETCIKCGKCMHTCPVSAIDSQMNGDTEKCISCMKCIKVCPIDARTLDNETVERIHNYLTENCKTRKEPELFICVS